MSERKDPINLTELCLLAGTKQYRYRAKEDLCKICDGQKERTLFLVFYDVDLKSFMHDFPDKKIKSLYPQGRGMVIKKTSRQHELSIFLFHNLITEKFRNYEPSITLAPLGAAAVESPDRRKQPDLSYIPETLPFGRSSEWPSFIVEVGYSEFERKLKADATWWLESSAGDVRRVVTMKIHQRRQEIILSNWTMRNETPGDNRQKVILAQSIEIHSTEKMHRTSSWSEAILKYHSKTCYWGLRRRTKMKR